jgi:hypothetical protein
LVQNGDINKDSLLHWRGAENLGSLRGAPRFSA